MSQLQEQNQAQNQNRQQDQPVKIVVRQLPPNLNPDQFKEVVSQFILSESILDYNYFVRGKYPLNPYELPTYSRAYIKFVNREELQRFWKEVSAAQDKFVFSDDREMNLTPQIQMCEFDGMATFPNGENDNWDKIKWVKQNKLNGTLKTDPLFQKFLKTQKKEIGDDGKPFFAADKPFISIETLLQESYRAADRPPVAPTKVAPEIYENKASSNKKKSISNKDKKPTPGTPAGDDKEPGKKSKKNKSKSEKEKKQRAKGDTKSSEPKSNGSKSGQASKSGKSGREKSSSAAATPEPKPVKPKAGGIYIGTSSESQENSSGADISKKHAIFIDTSAADKPKGKPKAKKEKAGDKARKPAAKEGESDSAAKPKKPKKKPPQKSNPEGHSEADVGPVDKEASKESKAKRASKLKNTAAKKGSKAGEVGDKPAKAPRKPKQPKAKSEKAAKASPKPSPFPHGKPKILKREELLGGSQDGKPKIVIKPKAPAS